MEAGQGEKGVGVLNPWMKAASGVVGGEKEVFTWAKLGGSSAALIFGMYPLPTSDPISPIHFCRATCHWGWSGTHRSKHLSPQASRPWAAERTG